MAPAPNAPAAMLRILDRYVIREVLPPFLLALLVFTFLLILQPIMDQAEALLAKGVPALDVARIIFTLVPQALGISIPVALLVGLLVAFGRMSSDREAVAFLACGISLWRLLRPVALLATLATGVTLYVLIVAIPDANQRFREITYRIVATRAEGDVKPRIFFEDFPGKVLYVGDVAQNGSWQDVFLADTSQVGWPVVYVAEQGHLVLDRDARRVELVLETGTRHSEETVLEFQSQTISLDPASVFPRAGPARAVQEMTIAQLEAQIADKRRNGLSPHTEIMALQQKFSIPVACLVFAVIALALGVTSRKDGKLAGFVVGIGVVFLYYVIMYTAEALTKGQWLPAEISRWTPNLVLGPLGVAALVWRSRWADRRLPFRLPAWLPRPAPGSPVSRTTMMANGRRVAVVVRVPRLDAPRPTILDRYVARLFLRVVVLAFAGLLSLVYIAAFIDRSSYLFKGQASGLLLLRYFWYETPQFIYWVLPLAVLLGTIATVGLLTRNSELTVMRACGISLYRTALPLMVMALIGSGVLFALEESILAASHRQADAIDRTIRGRPPRTMSVANRNWLVGKSGEIYHYALYDTASTSLFDLTTYEFDAEGHNLVRLTAARRAMYERGGWMAAAGWTRRYRGPGSRLEAETERFERRQIRLEAPDYFETELTSADMMTFRELRDHIQDLRASGFNVVPYLVQLQRKLAFPFVTVIMALLAVPFGVTTGRRGALYGIGLGIALALTYWLLTSVFGAIGTAGLLTPVLAAWAPNLVFGAGAVYLILTVRT